ncbi:MAG TPA: type II secretion system F family protein [Propionicimonas sp.]|jgi:type IV pilus assembly protein PilC|uniref:type II secretion system F family protein n=1 Tax=Propionicimonas sp. TaxID=1955623 RepID=UPI002F3FA7EE
MAKKSESFSYQAVDRKSGSVVRGNLEATDDTEVVAKLHAQGLVPLQVRQMAAASSPWAVPRFGRQRQVKVKSLALFARQLSNLVNAGLPLMRALTVLIDQADDTTLEESLTAVQSDVEAGIAFSAALEKHPKAFPPLMVRLVRVGEAGGFLGDSLKMIAETYQADADLQDKLKAAATYPLVVLAIAVLAMIGMLTFIVPVFETMFASLGGELPLPTRILVLISRNMAWIGPLLAVLVVGGWIWWSRNRHTEPVRKVVGPALLRLPVVGKLATKMAVSRFTRNLSMMLKAGVPLLQGLATVAQTSNNWAIEQAVSQVQTSVREGRSFARPLAGSGVFPPMVAQMVAVGEESGTLTEMLGSISDIYDGEVKSATEQLASVLEPILIVLVGIMIGSMVLALYMPIFGMYSQMAG